jgi:uncharacterized protein
MHCAFAMIAVLVIAGLMFQFMVRGSNRSPMQINPIVQVQSPQDIQRNTLTVSGTSQLTVSPDEALLYISIVTDNKTAKMAQENNRVTADAVIAALRAQGLNASDIETDAYTLTKLEDYVPYPDVMVGVPSDINALKGKYVERGYRLTHTIKATSRQIDKVGDIIDASVGAGANGIDQITFELTKESEKKVRDDALMKATEAAKEKAQKLAQTAGAEIVKVISINEQNFYYTPYSAYNVRSNVAMDGGMASAAPTVISPQKVDVTSSVGLVYEIK